MGVRGRKERMAFSKSFAPAYHFRLLYSSGTFFPIRGALRYTYGSSWDVMPCLLRVSSGEDRRCRCSRECGMGRRKRAMNCAVATMRNRVPLRLPLPSGRKRLQIASCNAIRSSLNSVSHNRRGRKRLSNDDPNAKHSALHNRRRPLKIFGVGMGGVAIGIPRDTHEWRGCHVCPTVACTLRQHRGRDSLR